MPATIVIKKDRDKPIRNQHPWIFSGAIDEVRGNPRPGEIVSVLSHNGSFLARGYWNAKSQIQVRLLTWRDESINEDWWRAMLKRAIDARTLENSRQRNQRDAYGYRVINAESDYIPGLIVDRYGDWLVLQALTLHIDQQKNLIARLLTEIFATLAIPVKGVYERSDVDIRKKEGLEQAQGLLLGEEPPKLIPMKKEALTRLVDVRNGHKTGYYLDQLSNQDFLAEFLNKVGLMDQARVLNLFSYTGGFGLGIAGYVVNVDASREVLELAEETYQLNNFQPEEVEFIQGDVFDYLRDVAADGQQFDVVVCDPPKFAQSAQQVDKAARGYKDLNLNSFKLIKSGGYLMTFSCSGAISPDLFQKIVFGALADSGRQAQIIGHLGAGEDHPIALTFPEGEYLKGLLLRVY
jgi:23S rRNA (cytosine1962-C5)-methyltransferase